MMLAYGYTFVVTGLIGLWSLSVAVASAGAPDSSPAGQAKNMILLISDGCGPWHVDAASIYRHGRPGAQVYEGFPVQLYMSTYEAGDAYDPEAAWNDFDYFKEGATDSAAAATAMATGVKTYYGAIGVDPEKKPVRNIVEHAEQLGKATGVVTSVYFSHATPAGFVAHNESRKHYVQIAREMIEQSAVDVIMGCGHPLYDDDGQWLDGSENFGHVGGRETFQTLREGTAGADADGDGRADPWVLIETVEDFRKYGSGPTPERLFGLPRVEETLQQERSGDGDAEPFTVPMIETVPTLAEMTAAALNVLDNDPDGFFLMVEGGAVDWAGHDNHDGRLIEEQIDFDRAVEAVVDWVEAHSDWQQTLVIVTSDHECGYLTGPGSGPTDEGPVWNPIKNNGAGVPPGMEWHSDGHTNQLVPVFARGAGAGQLVRAADRTDPRRGEFLDNTDLGLTMLQVLR